MWLSQDNDIICCFRGFGIDVKMGKFFLGALKYVNFEKKKNITIIGTSDLRRFLSVHVTLTMIFFF